MTAAQRRIVFLYGALGGIVPTLANLAGTYTFSPETPMPAFGMYFGLVMWAIVGGAVALTGGTAEVRQAIFAGIAAPAIISSLISGAGDASARKRVGALSFFISPAAAQTAPQARPKPDLPSAPTDWKAASVKSYVTILADVQGGTPLSIGIPVNARVAVDGATQTVTLGTINSSLQPATFALPVGTKEIQILGKLVPIPEGEAATFVDLNLQTRPSTAGDFLWALGAPREYTIQATNVNVVQKPRP